MRSRKWLGPAALLAGTAVVALAVAHSAHAQTVAAETDLRTALSQGTQSDNQTITFASSITLTPKAGLLYAAFFQGGFSETGSPGNDLTVAGQTYSSLRPFVGATLAESFRTPEGAVLRPEVRLAYSREVLGDGRTSSVGINGTSFVITGVSPSRNVLSAGAGITAALSNTLSLFADYNADIGFNNDTTHTVFAGFRMRF